MNMLVAADESTLAREVVLAKIPAFPPIVMRVLDLMAGENVEIADLVRLIGSDAVFSAQILRVANSPLFSLRSQIDGIQQAVVALGLSRVQGLAMTVATSNYMKAALKTDELFRCWRHMLATAILSRELALSGSVPADLAYTAGLLHDIGRLGLLVAYPHEYAAAMKTADRESLGLLDQERKVFGMDHCEAGRCLVEQWHFPADFQVVTGRHHDRQFGGAMDLLQVVHYACTLADSMGYFAIEPLQPAALGDIAEALPPAARDRAPAVFETLRQTVVQAIGAGDPAGLPAPAEAALAQPEAPPAPAEQCVAASATAGPAAVASSAFEAHSTAWDFTVVGITACIFLVVLTLAFLFWNPKP
jgi:HD-like signal output (HDOD) protein